MTTYNNFKDIIKTTLEAFYAIGNLEPLPLDSPASDIEQFNKVLDGLRQILGETTSLLVGISSNVVDEEGYHPILSDGRDDFDITQLIEEDEEEEEEEAPSRRSRRSTNGNTNQSRTRRRRRRRRANNPILPDQPQPDEDEDVAQHLDSIFAAALPGVSVQLQQFVQVVLHGYPGNRLQQEITMFQYALMGYQITDTDALLSAFHFFDRSLFDSSGTVSKAIDLEDVDDQTDKLLARESLLLSGPTSNAVSCFLYKIVYNIESTEAVRAWDKMSAAEKNDFRHRMAPVANPIAFNKLQLEDISEEEKATATNALVGRFTGKYDKLMQRRRYFLSIYNACGPSILLDPYLLSLTKSEYPTASRYLDKIMNGVLHRIQDQDWGLDKYNDNRRFLLTVARVLGGRTMYQYVKGYLEANNPWGEARENEEGEEEEGD